MTCRSSAPVNSGVAYPAFVTSARVTYLTRKSKASRIGRVSRIGIAVAAAGLVVAGCSSSDDSASNDAAGSSGTSAAAEGACDFRASTQSAAREVQPPTNTDPPTTGTVTMALNTTAGPITVTMDRAEAPCTVESMASLAEQKYFDDTPCHRLTTKGIFVLQCGDPSGQGSGGPGYTVPDEFPDNLQPAEENAGSGAVVYPRGTVAMANTGRPHSGGSQFFLVYEDSPLPPQYTAFGTIDDAGLAALDEIAAAGTVPGPGGMTAPAEPVQIIDATIT